MKKAVLFIAVSLLFLTSCTDNTNETEELLTYENELKLQLVDPEDDFEVDDEDIME